MEKLDKFIEDSKKLIGKEAEFPLVNTFVDRLSIVHFTAALGSKNPLFIDPDYASLSRYGCLVAPQTFLAAVKYPASEGAYSREDYSLAKFFTGAEFKFYDAIRCGDTLTSELKLKEIYEKPYLDKKRAAHLVAEGSYVNQHREVVGECRGTMSMVPFKRGEELLLNRDIYVYSDKEIAQIAKGIDASLATNRGKATLYWEDVSEGDKLTPVVKGPASLPESFEWRVATMNGWYSEEVVYRRALSEPGNRRVNPTTKWPYWHADQEQEDLFSCAGNGMPQPWVHGLHMICLAEDLLTKWMGDDGFLGGLSVEVYRPFIYGDTNWYGGEVAEKYKERLNGVAYKAVKIKIEVTNQLGEKTALGEATICLPSKGEEVKLPIPH